MIYSISLISSTIVFISLISSKFHFAFSKYLFLKSATVFKLSTSCVIKAFSLLSISHFLFICVVSQSFLVVPMKTEPFLKGLNKSDLLQCIRIKQKTKNKKHNKTKQNKTRTATLCTVLTTSNIVKFSPLT